MLDDFGRGFDEAFARSSPGQQRQPARRKGCREVLMFWLANLIVMPLVAMCYIAIVSEGLRRTMALFETPLYTLPVPGAALMREWDGFNRMDLALPFSLVACVAVSYVFVRVFKELQGHGSLLEQRQTNPILFSINAVIAIVVVAADAGLFYMGLESQASSTWAEVPSYVPVIATVIYTCGLALIGSWHSDFRYGGNR